MVKLRETREGREKQRESATDYGRSVVVAVLFVGTSSDVMVSDVDDAGENRAS